MRTRWHRDTGTGVRPGARPAGNALAPGNALTPGQAHGIHASDIADGAVQPPPHAINSVAPLPRGAFLGDRRAECR